MKRKMVQVSGNISLEYKINEKFNNTVTLSNTYIKRIYQAAPGSGNTQKDNYYGDRYSYSL